MEAPVKPRVRRQVKAGGEQPPVTPAVETTPEPTSTETIVEYRNGTITVYSNGIKRINF